MNDILLHPKTLKSLQYYLEKPSSVLVVAGLLGYGIINISDLITRELQIKPENIFRVGDEGLNVEQVRSISSFISLRQKEHRLVLIKALNGFDAVSQNAMLKILEEAKKNDHFIILVESESELLETVVSRSRILNVIRPQLKDFIEKSVEEKNLDPNEARKYFYINNGQFYIDADNNTIAAEARNFLEMSIYERLIWYSKQKFEQKGAISFVEQLIYICESVLSSTKSDHQISAWSKNLEYLISARDKLKKNVLIRLVFLNLMVKL